MTKDVKELGLITSGSLVEGLQMKLGPERSVEEVKAGSSSSSTDSIISSFPHHRRQARRFVPNILINPPRERALRSVPRARAHTRL
jgi:hypothetical protein